MTHNQLFFKFLSRSILNRKSRILVALAAIIIGASIVSALLSLSFDIHAKMSRELRVYGANLSIAPSSPDSHYITSETMDSIKKKIPANSLIGEMPYLFTLGKSKETRFVMAGIDFQQIPHIQGYWSINGNKVSGVQISKGLNSAYAGASLAKKMKWKSGDTLTIQLENENGVKELSFQLAGIVSTGASEENQFFIPLETMQKELRLPGKISLLQLSILGNKDSVAGLAGNINSSIPLVTASPILKITRAEGSILNKISFFMFIITCTILLISALTVMTTMASLTVERQSEIALVKAIGAEDKDVLKFFSCELLFLGIVGGITGYLIGFGMAQILGNVLFHTYIAIRYMVIPATLIISCLVTSIAGLASVRRVLLIEPAIILRGE